MYFTGKFPVPRGCRKGLCFAIPGQGKQYWIPLRVTIRAEQFQWRRVTFIQGLRAGRPPPKDRSIEGVYGLERKGLENRDPGERRGGIDSGGQEGLFPVFTAQ